MAEKNLQTRIKLRYDTYEHWSDASVAGKGANLVLLQGEMGVCYVPSVTQGTTTTAPTVLFKVGDDKQTPFAQLPWASGLAADVYDWAKTTYEKEYQIKSTTDNKAVIQAKNKSTGTFEDTGSTIELVQDTTNGHKIGFKINGAAPTQWITIPDSDVNQTVKAGEVTFGSNDVVNFVGGGDITVTGNSTDKTITISATNPAVGDGKLTVVAGSAASGTFTANQSGDSTITIDATTHQELTDAINALDVTDTAVAGKYISAVSETDGKISVTRENLPSVSVSENTATVPTSDTVDVWTGATGSGHTITADQATMPTKKYVDDQIATVSGGVVFKGTLGTGGTISTLPNAAGANKGHMYKVITDGTYAGQAAKVGDLFISSGSSSTAGTAQGWYYVPSGDEPSGTVTNIATGDGLTGGPITTSGTISHVAGSAASVSSAKVYKITTDSMSHVASTAEADTRDLLMTGYTKGATPDVAIATTDTASVAIGKLEASVDDVSGKISEAITTTVVSLDSEISATAATGNEYSVLTGITQSDGKLTAKTEVKLSAIAKTGNVNDLVQTSGDVIILNGGSSTTVI